MPFIYHLITFCPSRLVRTYIYKGGTVEIVIISGCVGGGANDNSIVYFEFQVPV